MEEKCLDLAPIHPFQRKEPEHSLGPAAVGAVELILQDSYENKFFPDQPGNLAATRIIKMPTAFHLVEMCVPVRPPSGISC